VGGACAEGPIVCGVELGGVSTAGDWSVLEPLFARARAAGLPVALHCGEDANNQAEVKRMLEFAPERLGHCVFLDDANMELLYQSGITVESCVTCSYPLSLSLSLSLPSFRYSMNRVV
jgi:adenosine deaminase